MAIEIAVGMQVAHGRLRDSSGVPLVSSAFQDAGAANHLKRMAEKENTTKRLGDFEILRELGRGGMGVVYEARQVSLNRTVALKVISGSLGLSDTAVKRFRREAEAAGRLQHTNIVPIYATGEADGTHYYAMELIAGPSLDRVLVLLRRERGKETTGGSEALPGVRKVVSRDGTTFQWGLSEIVAASAALVSECFGPASLTSEGESPAGSGDDSYALRFTRDYFDRVARMIAEVADAIEYAHQNGVIHRDIKPANLLLSPDGRLKVNDFGLARVLEQPRMTASGDFLGTPAYMSPEQIAAGRMKVDHRTDIYSLGVTLYELLTLRLPFQGQSRDQIIARILSKEPRPPRRVNTHIPLDLESVCLKAIEKDPDARYQSAGDLARDLARWERREPVYAKPPSLGYVTLKFARRHRAGVAVTAGVLLAILGLAAMSVYRIQRARQAAEIALFDMYTSFGLRSGEQGNPAQAVLWFASAAGLTPGDPVRERANRVRVRAWSSRCWTPVAALPSP